MRLVLTCEHAFPDIPEQYQKLFFKEPEILNTHEAYDPGAFDLFQELENLADFSHFQTIGRLLIETNRSKHHPKLFSRYSRLLSDQDKADILQIYYTSYRTIIESKIREYMKEGEAVIHLSVHTFTPVLNGVERNCDIGILYDPKRLTEKNFCYDFKAAIQRKNSKLKLRFNYPYLGKADGFTTALRKIFPENYSGIEIEVKQKWVSRNKMDSNIKTLLLESLKELINKH
tara:strand:- start:337 stop:1026 length:690 start_codon:yes stop_codon:yes gene_type:complete